MKKSKQRLTIGILSNSLDYDYQVLIWTGIQAAAEEADVNMICFSGAEINNPDVLRNERNKIFELISTQNIDGLIIIPSTICNFITIEEMERFFSKYQQIPMVSIGINLKNIPSIIIDNKHSFKFLVDHLIEVHGYKKFLYVGGPAKSIEANERLEIFKESLNEHGISIKPEHITIGNFFLQSTYYLVRDILNQKVKFDAIVAANDDMAMGAILALQEKNIVIPDEIAVIGFDDIKKASSLLVPLTTVRQPVFEVTRKAVNTLIDRINGVKVLDLVVMKTQPIIRKSCGCLNTDIEHVPINDLKLSYSNISDYNKIKKTILDELKKYHSLKLNKLDIDIYDLIIEYFFKFLRNEITDRVFIIKLDKILKKSTLEFFDNSIWNHLFFLLRKKIIPLFLNKPEMMIKIEDLIHQSCTLINEISVQIEKNFFIQLLERTRALQRIMRELVNSFNLQALLAKMALEFPKIGISSCYLSLHSSEVKMYKEARLILAYNKNGQIKLDKDGFLFSSKKLFPRDLIKLKERYDLIVEPLIYEKEHLGFVVLELSPFEGILITSMGDQIKSTIKASMLLQDTIDKGKKLEEMLFELNENQGKLIISEKMASLGRLTAGIAHEMNTPLAATRASLSEIINLINEYKNSISDPRVTAKDHYDIAKDMIKITNLANKSIEKVISFIKSIKSQTRENNYKEKIKFNIVKVINESILLLDHALKKNNLSIEFKFSKSNILLFGLPGRFSQIITNLITNAIDAMVDRKGENIKIYLTEEEKIIILKIEDSGCGIPDSIMTKIFDPLFTTKPFGQGTGLGLTIVHEIVNSEFNGSIEVESKVNLGTCFNIFFEKPD